MNLFEVEARNDRSEVHPPRKWLIVADSLYEAIWLVPQEWTVDAVEVRRAAAPGPGRVIGCMTGSTSSGKAGGPQPARPRCGRWVGSRPRRTDLIRRAPMEGTSILLLLVVSLGFVAGYWYASRGLASGADARLPLGMEAGQDRLRWNAPPEDTDPVCGKSIPTVRAKPSLHDGWVYYFCSQECREVFEAAPANYIPDARPKRLSNTHDPVGRSR